MKILHLISEKPPVKSGFSRSVGRLSEKLAEMGHEVDVLSAEDCYHKVFGEIKLVIGTSEVDKYLSHRYDIVNIHGHTPTFSDQLLLKSLFSKNRVVYTLHCLVDYYFKPVSILYNLVFNKLLLRFVDAIVVTSKSYYDMLRTYPRRYLVPWGVDHVDLTGKRQNNGYRLLFVGQMRPYKGLKVLLQAMKGLDAKLSVIGDGPDRVEYERYAQRLRLDNVHFYGSIPDDQLTRAYLSSDVLVLPSVSRNEAFGLVTLEAAAAGCAVVSSDISGLRDAVSEFGVLVKPKDPKGLREVLLTLKDKCTREEYVKRGVNAVEKYKWHQVAENYVKIYEGVLRSPYKHVM